MMAQMSRGRLDLLRPLNRCLAAANAQLHPAALSSGGRSSRVLPSHRTGSGHSGLRSACRLPSEACRSHRFLPDVRAALREVCRSLRGALRAPLRAAWLDKPNEVLELFSSLALPVTCRDLVEFGPLPALSSGFLSTWFPILQTGWFPRGRFSIRLGRLRCQVVDDCVGSYRFSYAPPHSPKHRKALTRRPCRDSFAWSRALCEHRFSRRRTRSFHRSPQI